jgi:glycine betaine/proline transport system substrate-binding protein
MKFIQVFASLLLLFSLGCTPKEQTRYTPIRIAYPHWAEGEALTFLAESFLQEMGYNVITECISVESIYDTLNTGSQDVFLDAWLPQTHEFYYEKYKDNLEILSTVIENARIGLVVPSYVPINSIEELNSKAKMFQGRIIGIDKGAGVMKQTERAIKEYGLSNFKLYSSSERNMITVLSFSINKRLPVIITGWDYHWKFRRYDLKYLEDPKGIYSKSDTIKIVTRKNFSSERPGLAKLLKNFRIAPEDFKSLLDTYRLMNTESEKKAAITKWMHSHSELLEAWKTNSLTKNN